MAAAIFYILYSGWSGDISILTFVALGLIFLETVALLVNDWGCPMTPIARRYTDDQRDNFDIYLPEWLPKYYGDLLPYPVRLSVEEEAPERINRTTVPFEQKYENDTGRQSAFTAFGKEQFGDEFLDGNQLRTSGNKTLEKAAPYLDGEVLPGLTSPRTGLSSLLAGPLKSEQLAEAKKWLPIIEEHLHSPAKAPLRLALPVMKYYLAVKDHRRLEALMGQCEDAVANMADRSAAGQFLEMKKDLA